MVHDHQTAVRHSLSKHLPLPTLRLLFAHRTYFSRHRVLDKLVLRQPYIHSQTENRLHKSYFISPSLSAKYSLANQDEGENNQSSDYPLQPYYPRRRY